MLNLAEKMIPNAAVIHRIRFVSIILDILELRWLIETIEWQCQRCPQFGQVNRTRQLTYVTFRPT